MIGNKSHRYRRNSMGMGICLNAKGVDILPHMSVAKNIHHINVQSVKRRIEMTIRERNAKDLKKAWKKFIKQQEGKHDGQRGRTEK